MAVSKSSLSEGSPISVRKPLEAKRNLFRKRPSATTKKVVSHNPKKPQSESKGTMINHDSIQTDPSVMKRAQVVQANLAAEFPSFVKLMLQSHVTGGFWLSFPKQFCDLHLPKHDDTVILVDESDEQYKEKYLVEKNGLSGGWRGFAIAQIA